MSDTSDAYLIKQAFLHAWIVEDQIPDEEMEERMRSFEQWWGGLDIEALKRALQEGNEEDKLVALFALGYLAYHQTQELLAPFLTSPVRKERWASAIIFGSYQDERAFALLRELLIEHLEAFSPPVDEHKIRHLVSEAQERARALYSSPATWERLAHPGLVQRWRDLKASRREYMWCMLHRRTILDILAGWNDPQAVPALRQALQLCWYIEPGTRGSLQDVLHQLEDRLAYTLGQLGAWHALQGLEMPGLPPSRFKLARMFLVFGGLQVNLEGLHLYKGNLTPLIESRTLDPDQVTQVLQERFGLDEYLARANLNVFQQWYQERDELWQWQKKLERGEIEGFSWPPQYGILSPNDTSKGATSPEES
jgi:hypothetical protein